MKENEQARIELLGEVEGILDEDLNKKPSENEWSIKQILEHLYLFEIDVLNAMKEEVVHGDQIEVEEKPIHLAVNRKVKVRAPEEVQPGEELATLEELKRRLEASRNKLREFMKETDEFMLEQRAIHHPGFKMMSLKQWVSFIGWHEK